MPRLFCGGGEYAWFFFHVGNRQPIIFEKPIPVECCVYGPALEDTLPGASFDEHLCESAGANGSTPLVSIATELTLPRSVLDDAQASPLAHVNELVSAAISDGSFESAIVAGATGRRRLGMADISVRAASVATFSPTAVPTTPPTPLPSPLPVPRPTAFPSPIPIPAPTPAPTTLLALLGGRYLTVVIIGVVLAVVMCCCVLAFAHSLIRHRRQAKERNATALDVPDIDAILTSRALEDARPRRRAAETSSVDDIALGVAGEGSDAARKKTKIPIEIDDTRRPKTTMAL